MIGQWRRRALDGLVPAEGPRWHGSPVTPDEAAAAGQRAVEFKWDAFRAHEAVREQAIAALTELRLSVREVARVLGVSRSLVAKQLRKRYFETPEFPRSADASGRAARSPDLIARAWNGLWRPERDPDYGTGRPDEGDCRGNGGSGTGLTERKGDDPDERDDRSRDGRDHR